jgi:hypothetical protein
MKKAPAQVYYFLLMSALVQTIPGAENEIQGDVNAILQPYEIRNMDTGNSVYGSNEEMLKILLPSTLGASKDADAVFKLLITAPKWSMLGEKDDAKREKITEIFTTVAHYDTATIRIAVKRIIYCNRGNFNPDVGNFCLFNLMALNRFVFNVPEFISNNELDKIPFYLGMRLPEEGDMVKILWPLSKASDNKVRLTSLFYANSGPLPNPLDEFDSFAKVFGRRFKCASPDKGSSSQQPKHEK